jgi:phosphoribosylanthranilate isomerase
MTKVKICGITNKVDASMAANYGADAIGIVNVRGSKRFVDLDRAADIFCVLPVFVSRVIVAMPESIEEALQIEETGADYIQLHGDEPVNFIRELRENTMMGIIKKVSVDENSITDSVRYSRIADAILLDTKVKGAAGGTGIVHDWDMSRKVVDSVDKPVILAGGINPGNVGDAIERVNPYAVDVSSGVESKLGSKDKNKLEKFITIVKNETT